MSLGVSSFLSQSEGMEVNGTRTGAQQFKISGRLFLAIHYRLNTYISFICKSLRAALLRRPLAPRLLADAPGVRTSLQATGFSPSGGPECAPHDVGRDPLGTKVKIATWI